MWNEKVFYIEGKLKTDSLEEVKKTVGGINKELRDTVVHEIVQIYLVDPDWSFVFETDTSMEKGSVERVKEKLEEVLKKDNLQLGVKEMTKREEYYK